MTTPGTLPHARSSSVGLDEWQWPVDRNRYQRHPSLGDLELQALDLLLNGQAFPRVLPAPLQHLLLPVQEALEASHTNPKSHFSVRRILLTEMHKRRRSLWDWTPKEWTEILCSTAVAFEEHYPSPVPCRQQVLTVAYLLCDFTDFHTLGSFGRKLLANTIFGKARMEMTVQRVVEGARLWGLSGQHAQSLHTAVREALLVNRSPYLEDLTIDVLFMMSERTQTRALKIALRMLSCALMTLGLFHATLSEVPYPASRSAGLRRSAQSSVTQKVAPRMARVLPALAGHLHLNAPNADATLQFFAQNRKVADARAS